MNAVQGTGRPGTQRGRVESVDLLRGWAVMVMIETHLVNATITPMIAETGLFQWLKFINGLVAPSFLFASGLAYAVTTRRKVNDYLTFGPPLFRQLGRILVILAIGYLLHIPHFSLASLREGVTETEWLTFLQVDVLQCIAFSLLFMQALLLLLRSERRMYAVLAVLTPVMLVVTPLLWGDDTLSGWPAPVAAFLNGRNFSLFPIFPWSVFLFSGALTGYAFSLLRESPEGERTFMLALPAAGVVLILAALATSPVAASLYPTYDYWRFGPPFVLLRLGIVMLLLTGMFLYERRVAVARNSVVTLVGRESLLVYAAHLLLIYGDFGSYNFRKAVNSSYGYAEAALGIVALLLLMYGTAFFWEKTKRERPRLKTTVIAGVLALLVLVFFFGPAE
jgi:uncharacterized membrane protein